MNSEKKGKIWYLVKTGFTTLLLIVMFVLAYQGININKDPNYIPSIFGHTYLNVLSGSMEPEFSAKDLIIGKNINENTELKVGDVITFKDQKILTTHRIVGINEDGTYTTKGDANGTEDLEPVSKEQVVSVYKVHIPKIGILISKFHNFEFLGLLWIILMFAIISEIVKEAKKEKEKNKETKEEAVQA